MKPGADNGLRLSGRAILAMLAKEHSLREREFAARISELVAIIHELDRIPRCTVWPADKIELVARRQNYKCAYCDENLPPLRSRSHHVDHRIPWSMGGGNELSNIQLLHKRCNLTKSAQYDNDELLDYLEDRLRNI
jgi:HNH endonuclease